MDPLDISRKEAGLLPLWVTSPDQIETLSHDQALSPFKQFELDYSSGLSLKRNEIYLSSESVSVCGVTLASPQSPPPSTNLNIKRGRGNYSCSSPNIYIMIDHQEYFENMRISTNWKEIAEIERVKRSKSLDSLATVNIKDSKKVEEKGVIDKFKGIIDKTIKSRNVIRKIRFAVEENKNEDDKKKKMVSPPPRPTLDDEEDDGMDGEDDENDETKEVQDYSPLRTQHPSGGNAAADDVEDVLEQQKQQQITVAEDKDTLHATQQRLQQTHSMSIPKLLVHSASFYMDKPKEVQNVSPCPLTPRKVFSKTITCHEEPDQSMSVVSKGHFF